MGHSRTLFLYFHLFYLYNCTMGRLNFADVGIRTADLWCRKRPLYQLSHHHCPNSRTVRKQDKLISYLFRVLFPSLCEAFGGLGKHKKMVSMSSTGCLSSNKEAFINTEMMAGKWNHSGWRTRWEKSSTLLKVLKFY